MSTTYFYIILQRDLKVHGPRSFYMPPPQITCFENVSLVGLVTWTLLWLILLAPKTLSLWEMIIATYLLHRPFPNSSHELIDLVRAQNLAIVFLAKTCLDETRLIGIRVKLNFGGYFGVSQVNCGGGLDLFWKHNCAVYVETSSPLML